MKLLLCIMLCTALVAAATFTCKQGKKPINVSSSCVKACISTCKSIRKQASKNEKKYLRFIKTFNVVRKINKEKRGWKAEMNRFATWSKKRLHSLFGGKKETENDANSVKPQSDDGEDEHDTQAAELEDLPKSFDLRKERPNCVHPIISQGACASCYVTATIPAIADRYCFKTNVTNSLSIQEVMSCSNYMRCGGGKSTAVYDSVRDHGVGLASCSPYVMNAYKPVLPACKKCATGRVYIKGAWVYRNELEMMRAIYTGGSITSVVPLLKEFTQYKSGIFNPVGENAYTEYHFVRLVGWGEEAGGKKYWIAANSWGTGFGMNGYFHIRKGARQGIEYMAFGANIDVTRSTLKIK